MSIKSIVYKSTLNIADLDRHYYVERTLTLAKHPSETEERLMVRLLAFMIFADENLAFGKGISDDDPALWLKDATGAIDLWIELGQPDERTIRKACTRAKQVVLILYGAHTDLWWKHHQEAFAPRANLTVLQLTYKDTQALAAMAERTMDLTCNIEEGRIMLISDSVTLYISPFILQKNN
jgi:uncharacterized protein YaeQ